MRQFLIICSKEGALISNDMLLVLRQALMKRLIDQKKTVPSSQKVPVPVFCHSRKVWKKQYSVFCIPPYIKSNTIIHNIAIFYEIDLYLYVYV